MHSNILEKNFTNAFRIFSWIHQHKGKCLTRFLPSVLFLRQTRISTHGPADKSIHTTSCTRPCTRRLNPAHLHMHAHNIVFVVDVNIVLCFSFSAANEQTLSTILILKVLPSITLHINFEIYLM